MASGDRNRDRKDDDLADVAIETADVALVRDDHVGVADFVWMSGAV